MASVGSAFVPFPHSIIEQFRTSPQKSAWLLILLYFGNLPVVVLLLSQKTWNRTFAIVYKTINQSSISGPFSNSITLRTFFE